MTDTIANIDHVPAHKLTAAQVETDCPERLKQIGREITERLAKAEKQADVVENHLIAVNQLLAEAKGLCDRDGFNQFREQFCPQLGKSQAYKRLAIAAGKMTLADHRTEERDRKRKTRANQKGDAVDSGTVPEKLKPEVLDISIESSEPDTCPGSKHSAGTLKLGSEVTPEDDAESNFRRVVLELDYITNNEQPERFAKTNVERNILDRLAKLLGNIANLKLMQEIHELKKPSGSSPAAPASIGTVLVEQPIAPAARTPALEV